MLPDEINAWQQPGGTRRAPTRREATIHAMRTSATTARTLPRTSTSLTATHACLSSTSGRCLGALPAPSAVQSAVQCRSYALEGATRRYAVPFAASCKPSFRN